MNWLLWLLMTLCSSSTGWYKECLIPICVFSMYSKYYIRYDFLASVIFFPCMILLVICANVPYRSFFLASVIIFPCMFLLVICANNPHRPFFALSRSFYCDSKLLLDLQTLLKCVAWGPMFGWPHPPTVLLWEFDAQPWASGADVASWRTFSPYFCFCHCFIPPHCDFFVLLVVPGQGTLFLPICQLPFKKLLRVFMVRGRKVSSLCPMASPLPQCLVLIWTPVL